MRPMHTARIGQQIPGIVYRSDPDQRHSQSRDPNRVHVQKSLKSKSQFSRYLIKLFGGKAGGGAGRNLSATQHKDCDGKNSKEIRESTARLCKPWNGMCGGVTRPGRWRAGTSWAWCGGYRASSGPTARRARRRRRWQSTGARGRYAPCWWATRPRGPAAGFLFFR